MSRPAKIRTSTPEQRSRKTARRSLRDSSTTKHLGLCTTCVNAPDCTFPRVRGQAVFHCEEFDGQSAGWETTRSARATQSARRPVRDKDAAKFMGLCSNCDNRKACVFPKPESGVWHCEEYL